MRDLEGQIEELQEDLEAERAHRERADRDRRSLQEELESLKTECLEATDKTNLSLEIQKKKDEQLRQIQVRGAQ